MTADTIEEFLHATPFKPFTVHMAEQTDVQVPHPDFAMLTKDGRVLVVNTEGSRVKHIDMFSISSISLAEEAGATA